MQQSHNNRTVIAEMIIIAIDANITYITQYNFVAACIYLHVCPCKEAHTTHTHTYIDMGVHILFIVRVAANWANNKTNNKIFITIN